MGRSTPKRGSFRKRLRVTQETWRIWKWCSFKSAAELQGRNNETAGWKGKQLP